ncbi:hypothetical protein GGS21DRAFT_223147 [Xylaria nigripes]|nr:hypothetical protein GGS21DRAFT_223147 [Xylaria nigripes]
MPRKIRPAADQAQNRQNQQRSRARRKAYVAELEARVRGFEEEGVRATVEMQRAAREVAWVNARLMELLAAKGVARGEVDAFLRRAGEGVGWGLRETPSSCGAALEALLAGAEADERRCRVDDGRDFDVGAGAAGHMVNEPFIRVCDGVSEMPRQRLVAEGSSALVTSCQDAASIIADFQGHGDVLRVRNVLGCGDATDCHVKNTRLFQLMDETS